MKSIRPLFFALGFSALMIAPAFADGENTRLTNPNAAYIEILGRGIRYSIGYDRALNDYFVAGFGFGSTLLDTDAGVATTFSAKMIPIYLNYYFMPEAGSVFASGGVDFVLNPRDAQGLKSTLSSLKYSSGGVVPTAGIGYENRGDFGFLFRMAAYVLIDRSVAPWVGFTFGYAF